MHKQTKKSTIYAMIDITDYTYQTIVNQAYSTHTMTEESKNNNSP